MEIHFVRAHHEVAHVRDRAIRDDLDRLLRVDRAEVARRRAEGLDDLGFGRHAEVRQTRQLACLDLVQLVIAAQHQQPDGRFSAFVFRGEDDRLDRALERNVQQLSHGLALCFARRCGLLHFLGRRRAFRVQRQRFGRFNVRCEIRGRAIGDRVFTGVGDHVEFMRAATADRTVVRGHGAEIQTKAREDPHVRVVHLAIRLAQAFRVFVERVRVFHDELASAHHAETRTDFVAELRLDLIEVHRQLAIALDLASRDVRDHFFVGRSDHEIGLLAILEAQQFGAVFFPTARFLPQLGRLHCRHQQFDRTCPVHFFAHDGFHLADRTQADRQVVIDAAGDAADHAGAHHELVADDLGVGRRFFQRADKETGSFHSDFPKAAAPEGPPER